MKNEITKLKLAMGFLILTTVHYAYAATQGTLTMSGSVGSVLEIVVTPNGTNNSTLNITGGESAKNVADVAETSNNLTGYHIDLVSANNGELRRGGSPTIFTPYQISYDGGLYFSPTSTGTVVKNVPSLTGLTTDHSAVLTNVTAFTEAPTGTYSDTLTISIEANP